MNIITIEIKNDIMNLISSFYAKFEPEVAKYQHLDIINRSVISIDEFYETFILCHAEIRKDTKNKVRYFIQRKLSKLNKITDDKLPEYDIINDTCPTTVDFYWDTLFHIYILMESCMEDIDQTVINTIASEIAKHTEQIELIAQNAEDDKRKKDILADRHTELLKEKMDELDLPDVNSLLSKVNDPMVMEVLKKFTGQDNIDIASMLKQTLGTDNLDTVDINSIMKQTLGENKEIATMLSTLMDSYNNGDKTMDMSNMSSILDSVIPTVDSNCEVNNILIEKMFNDLLYVYEKKDNSHPAIEDRISTTSLKYMNLINRGSLQINELLGCLWKVANNEEKQNYIVTMDKEDLTADTTKILINKYVPKDILSQIPIDINMIIDSFFDGGFTDMSSMFDMAKTYMSGHEENIKEVILDEDQSKEMEEYYDKMMNNCEETTSCHLSSSSVVKSNGTEPGNDTSSKKKNSKKRV